MFVVKDDPSSQNELMMNSLNLILHINKNY